MFEFIRTHQRLMQFILLLLILPSFVFFGVQGYSRFVEGENAVAKVDGHPITQQEYDAAQRDRLERYRQQFGGQFDSRLLDTPEARKGLLDELIINRVVAAEATRNNLTVTEASINQTLGEIPQIRALFGPDGKLNMDLYKQFLASQGLSHEGLRQRVRDNLVRQQVASSLVASSMLPKTVVDRVVQLYTQKREVQELAFAASAYAAEVKVTSDEIKQYYDAHSQAFQLPEQVDVEYVVLDQQAIAASIPVSADDVKSYYEQNRNRYRTEEMRRSSHILIKVAKDAKPAEKEAAKAKIQALLAQARKNPNDFARLAKENSQDEGSAANGGDLDFVGRGSLVKPFEDALFKLKEGEISDPVETEYGYHIIKLTGIKPEQAKTLEEVKPEIEQEIRRQQATRRFAELAETFTNMVYEQSDSLKPVADKLKLDIKTEKSVTRAPMPGQNPNLPIFKDKMRAALFTNDVLKNKRNTEAVDVGNNTLVSARVTAHTPARVRPLAEVSEQIKMTLVQERAAQKANALGKAKLAELQKAPSDAGFGPAKSVSRTDPAGLPPDALAAIMKADVSKLPAYVGVDLGARGYGIYRIGKVETPPAPDAAQLEARTAALTRAEAEAEAFAYLEALRKRHKAEILKDVTQKATDENAPETGDQKAASDKK